MKLLVVIDMQNDFIDGALGTKEAQGIVPNVVKKIREYNLSHYPVYYTMDTHDNKYLTTQEGKKLAVEHCIYPSNGWMLNEQIANELHNTDNLIEFKKDTFGSLNLAKEIDRSERYSSKLEIELVGVCTDMCVISNALILKAAMPETTITIDASCCAGVTPESHKKALEVMKMCQINVINE